MKHLNRDITFPHAFQEAGNGLVIVLRSERRA